MCRTANIGLTALEFGKYVYGRPQIFRCPNKPPDELKSWFSTNPHTLLLQRFSIIYFKDHGQLRRDVENSSGKVDI
jgi:hypothetical protein